MDKEKLTVKERAFVEEHERKHKLIKEIKEMREKRNQSNVATDYPINSKLEEV